ncbi:MAG: S8 family serine peptidase [Bacteroidetes bacterium]|nr:S8 family serine peptidase [Bacteroidota bacterium]
MKKNLIYVFLVVLTGVFACNKPEDNLPEPQEGVLKQKANPVAVPAGDPLSQTDLDKTVIGLLESRNDFQWEWVDVKTLWSAVQYNDHSVAIGYKPLGAGDISSKLHEINVKSGAYKEVHDALIAFILKELNAVSENPVSLNDILVEDDQVLPILTIRLTDKNVLTALYNLENVRYIEPLDYWPADLSRISSSSGCDASTQALNAADYTTITPGARLPWNYNNQNVPAAWNVSQGQGITIGVIDAGISSSQPLLGASFNNGDSNVGRAISTDYTLGNGPYNSCTHGNSMCGQAAGPRNNQNATTGVAYKSNLHFIRACNDVVLDASSEKTAVKNALIRMGNRGDVKIISMSIGTPFSSGVLKDGVDYAYGLGKFILAAAGTSFSWTSWWGVIYPAAYSSCVAVTGVKENGSKCSSCHDGGAVLYTITMERTANSNRNSLTLPFSGVTPSYIGGSSSATSTAAGIAALVWSTKPNMTRAQLQTCLTNTAQFYPSRNSTKGYGNLNAGAAVNYAVANY